MGGTYSVLGAVLVGDCVMDRVEHCLLGRAADGHPVPTQRIYDNLPALEGCHMHFLISLPECRREHLHYKELLMQQWCKIATTGISKELAALK